MCRSASSGRKGNGIRFKGSAAFEVTLHPHPQLGPVRIDEVTVRLAAAADGSPKVRLELGAGISGQLGPLQFMLDGIGVAPTFRSSPATPVPSTSRSGFKPPNGVGLAIDGGGFTGGGFLIFDRAKGEYAGALELIVPGHRSTSRRSASSTRRCPTAVAASRC